MQKNCQNYMIQLDKTIRELGWIAESPVVRGTSSSPVLTQKHKEFLLFKTAVV